MFVSLEEGKRQLGVTDTYRDEQIKGLLNSAVGIVCSEISRDIYMTSAEVPENAVDAIVYEELTEVKQWSLKSAVLLMLTTLWVSPEATTEKPPEQSLAFKASIKPFKRVFVG